MTRFVASTSAVLAEVANSNVLSPEGMHALSLLGLTIGLLGWWSAAQPVINRLVGMDDSEVVERFT